MDAVITPIARLDGDALAPLIREAVEDGYGFVQTLWDEYESGKNRFDTPGAALLGVYESGRLIGVGGVQQDPYLKRADAGRVRHVYVLREFRRHGVGKQLLEALIAHARQHFDLLTLRTNTEAAAAFYVALGFSDAPEGRDATHWMRLND